MHKAKTKNTVPCNLGDIPGDRSNKALEIEKNNQKQ